MTSPSQSSTPLGTGLPYLGIPQNNPGQNWYRRRDPTVRDFRNYQVLDRWINLATHTIFYLTAKTAGSATWAAISGGGSGMQTIGDGFGVSVSPVAGEVELLGTANEIISTGGVGTVTFSMSPTLVLGSLAGANGVSISVGMGNFLVQGAPTSTITIGTGLTTGTILIGGTAQTGSITLGSSSGINIVNVGTGEGATTVNIATGATAAKTVNIGTGAAMANTIAIGGTGANVITIGNTQALGSITMGAAATTQAISIGSAGNIAPLALLGGVGNITLSCATMSGQAIARRTATNNAFSADGNNLQSYVVTTGGTPGTTYRAIRGDIHVNTGNGTESPVAVRGAMDVLASGDLEESYGGFFNAYQTDGSEINANLIGVLGIVIEKETGAVSQPQQWIAGSQSIVSFDAAAAVPTAAIVCGALSHVMYDAPMNTKGHGFVASRNGGGAGGPAGSAFKVVLGGGIKDWTYGLDLYTGNIALDYNVADIRLSQLNTIKAVAGYPTGATTAGSVAVRSDGTNADSVLYVNASGAVNGWRPVLRSNSTWIESFTQSPVMTTALTTGGAPTGATGNLNLMCLQGGEIMQQFILGAGQTIIAPRMDGVGLNVALDLTVAEGAEYNWGTITNISKHAFLVGTTAPKSFIMSFAVADVTGAGPILMGFRKQEANNAAFAAYTDFAAIGLNNAINPATIIIESRLNSGAVVTTNTTNAWVDGANHTLRVNIATNGVVTYAIDGAAPAVTQAFTFDNGDWIHPFFHFLHAAVAPGAIEWTDLVCGPV